MKYYIRTSYRKGSRPGIISEPGQFMVGSYSREEAIDKCREYLKQGYAQAGIVSCKNFNLNEKVAGTIFEIKDEFEEIFLPCNAEKFIEEI